MDWRPASEGRKAELTAIASEAVEEYDRAVDINCPCFVEMGAYPSVDECRRWQISGQDWVSCVAKVLTTRDSPRAREAIRCYAERLATYADCIDKTRCDPEARTTCDTSPLGCVTEDGGDALELGIAVANQCTDIPLLTRQH